jgi:hypothetical protein
VPGRTLGLCLRIRRFVLRVQALQPIHNQVTPENTPDLMPVFVDEFSTHAKELNVAVAHFVEQRKRADRATQSWRSWIRRQSVRRRLRQRTAELQKELGGKY